MINRFMIHAVCTIAMGAAAAQAQSTKWPERPVRVIVPFPAGGTSDVVARLFTPRLSEEYGQQFVIDNRPGAGGTIGTEIAARAAPDGHTVAMVPSSYAAAAALYKLPYDPIKGIAPISMMQIVPFILVVHPSVKADNLKAFIELARTHSGTLNFGSPGTGSTPHLAAELFQQLTNSKFTHVAYKGDGQALADLLGGQVHINIATAVLLGPQIKSGKVRALGVTATRRSRSMPELPAIGELVPGFAADGWSGIWAPGGTPAEIVSRLNLSIGRILKAPEVVERLRGIDAEPTHSTPEEFARFIAAEVAKWRKVVATANIKLN
ncbi:MAG: tripartite tricarboxylate transporter substrate binding protein [Betaproteobacteria bacterium]|nr:tripartite tricarboxylate transporter substrate binding protein [Betaproteobacteria bacterium]